MRLARTLAAFLLIVGIACADDLRNPFCRVRVPMGNQSSLGSGTLVDRNEQLGLVITAAHVVSDSQDGFVVCTFVDGQERAGRIIGTDQYGEDLAAISIERPDVVPIAIGAAADDGETIYLNGFGGGGRLRQFVGRITGWGVPQGSSSPSAHVSSPAQHGDSGGGAFNSQGEMVGVLWGSDLQSETMVTIGKPFVAFLQRLAGNHWNGSATFMQQVGCPGGSCGPGGGLFGGGCVPGQCQPYQQRPPSQPYGGNFRPPQFQSPVQPEIEEAPRPVQPPVVDLTPIEKRLDGIESRLDGIDGRIRKIDDDRVTLGREIAALKARPIPEAPTIDQEAIANRAAVIAAGKIDTTVDPESLRPWLDQYIEDKPLTVELQQLDGTRITTDVTLGHTLRLRFRATE